MTVSTSQAISRKAFVATALAAMGAAAGSPLKLIAQEAPTDVLDRFLINVDGNTVIVVDSETGDYGIITFDQTWKTASVVYSYGTTSNAYTDASGNVYVDGVLVATVTTVEAPVTRAVPSGYVHLVTQRYVITVNPAQVHTVADVINAIITLLSNNAGLVYGFIGAMASILIDRIADGIQSGYLEITQYYHPQTYYIYTIATLYANSNYTGVLGRWEDGPRPPV